MNEVLEETTIEAVPIGEVDARGLILESGARKDAGPPERRNPDMLRRVASAVAVMALLSACSSSDPGTSASPSVASSTSGSSSVSVDPSASTGGCTPPVLCGEELAPGEYSATVTNTETTFTVGDGWVGTAYQEVGFDMFRVGDPPEGLSAVPYAGVVYADVCSGEETQEIGATAADFVAFLADRPGIEARGEATEASIGGRSGLQIDVDAVDPGCESEPPERLWLWDINFTDFHLNVGEAARFVVLDDESGVIVLVIETFDPATFDSLLELTQPVLDSMTFS